MPTQCDMYRSIFLNIACRRSRSTAWRRRPKPETPSACLHRRSISSDLLSEVEPLSRSLKTPHFPDSSRPPTSTACRARTSVRLSSISWETTRNTNGMDPTLSCLSELCVKSTFAHSILPRLAQSLWAYMTSYSKLNGTHCSENKWLLQDLLRKEWGHDGLIMSDWYGTYSISESINAGLNLEMPGPTEMERHGTGQAPLDGSQDQPSSNRHCRCASPGLGSETGQTKMPILSMPSHPPKRPGQRPKQQTPKILRRVGGEGIVLLKNKGDILPITSQSKKVAVIGPNAKARVLTGGGSASLRCAWSQSPWEGLEANKPNGVELTYSLGATTSKFLPLLDSNYHLGRWQSRFQPTPLQHRTRRQAGG